MTVREDAEMRADEYDRSGNYFLADLIRTMILEMSEDILDREIGND